MHATGVPGAQGLYERKPKASHRDTVNYEIGMLRFCFELVTGEENQERKRRDLYIEGFLLHYRNVIRFFSGNNHQDDDLSMNDPSVWAGRDVSAQEIGAMRASGQILDAKYHREISKYLQHCTTLRYERSKAWDVAGMKKELDPIIAEFERAFPELKEVT